jgi:NADH:ubiquinone oxidoreductase subunit 2 (subunit N)
MYIEEPPRPEPVPVRGVLLGAILVCAAGVIVMGVYPQPWVQAALQAASSLF